MSPAASVSGPPSSQIKNLFGSIAQNYDLTNDLMTLGLARIWRRRLVRESGDVKGAKVLDAATGTGDLALLWSEAVGVTGEVHGIDFCEPMLEKARLKTSHKQIKFVCADILNLPFPDHSFDVVSVAYGIRNVENVSAALRELHRVLKPMGRLMILETGDTDGAWLGPVVKLHFRFVVPWMGALTSGSKDAYNYLQESSQHFPSGQKFCDIVSATAPFSSIEHYKLFGGASFLYRATK